jgi:hypothetical protein
MGQQLPALKSRNAWRSGKGERLWLSMLIDTMEQVARPELRAMPCDPTVLAALTVQLAQPASPCLHCASSFSFRN